MQLFQQLPNMCAEFCELIENRSEELQFRIDDLLKYLEDEFFHSTLHARDGLVEGLDRRLEEVWALVPDKEDLYPEFGELYQLISNTIWRPYKPPNDGLSDDLDCERQQKSQSKP